MTISGILCAFSTGPRENLLGIPSLLRRRGEVINTYYLNGRPWQLFLVVGDDIVGSRIMGQRPQTQIRGNSVRKNN